MTITLDLPPEVSDRAQAQAARQQVPLQDYLARIVADAVSETEDAPSDSPDPGQSGAAGTFARTAGHPGPDRR